MKNYSEIVIERMEAVRRELEKALQGKAREEVRFEALLGALPEEKWGKEKASRNRQLTYVLGELRKDPSFRFSVTIREKTGLAFIKTNAQSVWDIRSSKANDAKVAIGVGLWNFLFNQNLSGNVSDESVRVRIRRSWEYREMLDLFADDERAPIYFDNAAFVKHEVEQKRRILCEKNNMAVVIDSGTTNYMAMEQLLRESSFPIEIRDRLPDPRDHVEGAGDLPEDEAPNNDASDIVRLVSPIWITNSLDIARLVSGHRDRHNMILRVIGGTERQDRHSLTGALALLWLRACMSDGQMISADLSIVGTTGFDSQTLSIPFFGSDDSDEAALKARMLQLSHFRIITMDSTKLRSDSASSCFATLSNDSVHLIVVDDGSGWDGGRAAVWKLCEQADLRKVGVLVISKTVGSFDRAV